MISLLTLTVYLIVAGFAIWSGERKSSLFRILKPAPIFLLILFSVFTNFNPFLLGALFFSATGDIFLLNKEKFFSFGLASFLTAHLLYSYLFYSFGSSPDFMKILFIVIIALSVFSFLKENLGKYLFPVFIYIIAISIMTILSLGFAGNNGFLIASGGILFFISDGVLAVNKFKLKIKRSNVIILSTYYLAQLMIVLGFVTK